MKFPRLNLPKTWYPDPKISALLRPYYVRGFTASEASTFLIRDIGGKQVELPNAKTCYHYWRYWKYLDSVKIYCSIRAYSKLHQKHLEDYYLSQYDKLVLVCYDMEKLLETKHDGKFNGISFVPADNSKLEIDVSLETLILKVSILQTQILQRKFTTENNLILWYFKFNYSALLKRTIKATHKMLIHVLNFLSKKKSKQFVLDCQCKNKEPDQTVVKCGICASKVVPLLHTFLL
ncbi:hypothetical protein NsoK4_08200 [Nitrosopumilus sp. K4]|uniref:hypothetical protein n=1 Tax=Nitrosopumilus sp. K4 TaxID=2795383 RepID=UPI001BA9DE3B|nr:hypothetical protein [Nitrosopumilus sp. K4]QUC64397.1 hypothetical protein NsoK4_08200 [Nitrosopumilus sp. K4]